MRILRSDVLLAFKALLLATVLQPSSSAAQEIDVSIVRAAGAVCAAGFSPEVQDRLDTQLSSAFSALRRGGASAVNPDQAGMVLETLSYNPVDDAEETYMKCVSETLKSVLAVSTAATAADSGRPVIDTSLVADPLDVMQSGDRFQIGIGDSRAVSEPTLLFALIRVGISGGQRYVRVTMSDVAEAKSQTADIYQANTLKLNDRCSLNPYAIDLKTERASFLVFCR